MPKNNIYADPWKEIAQTWKNMKSPNIPSSSEIAIYDKYIKQVKIKNKNAKTLIFGATPQLRDLFYKNKIRTTVCDINIEMILAMVKLCRYKNIAKNEIWIKADWLTAPLPKNYFDIIICDAAINQLPLKYYQKFLSIAKTALKSGGVFLQRVIVIRRDYLKSDNEIMEHYLIQKHPDPDIVFETLFLFSSALNRKNMTSSVKNIYKIMDSYLKNLKGQKKIKLKKIITKMENSYPRNNKTWTILFEQKMSELYKKYFKKVNIEFGKQYGKIIPSYPIFIAKK